MKSHPIKSSFIIVITITTTTITIILLPGVNGFSGQIPPSIAMLLELEVLDLSFNALIGGLEGNIGHLEKKSENLRAVDLCTLVCVSVYSRTTSCHSTSLICGLF